MKNFSKKALALVLSFSCLHHFTAFAQSGSEPIYEGTSFIRPVVGYQGMAATQNYHATEAAAKVLSDGGNAIDAAVTAAFVLSVTLPLYAPPLSTQVHSNSCRRHRPLSPSAPIPR